MEQPELKLELIKVSRLQLNLTNRNLTPLSRSVDLYFNMLPGGRLGPVGLGGRVDLIGSWWWLTLPFTESNTSTRI